MLVIYIPIAPTVNNYYAHTKKGVFIKAAGKRYREAITREVIEQHAARGLDSQLHVSVVLHFKDKRRRDLDNYMKGMLDALTHAGVWDDDKQIDQLSIYRGEIVKEATAVVIIREAGPVIPSQKAAAILGLEDG